MSLNKDNISNEKSDRPSMEELMLEIDGRSKFPDKVCYQLILEYYEKIHQQMKVASSEKDRERLRNDHITLLKVVINFMKLENKDVY